MSSYPPTPPYGQAPYPAPAPGPAPVSQQPPAGPARGRRRYGTIRAIALAPFSSDLWRDVAGNWRGIGLMYMLVLLVLTWLPIMVKGYVGFSTFVRDDAPRFVEEVPPVTIRDGVVSSDVPQPHVIKNPDNGQPFIVIDTTGGTLEPPPGAPSMLLTRSALLMRKSEQEVRTYDLSEVKSFAVDKHRVYGWLNVMKQWFLPLLLPLMVVLSLIGRLILMLITAAIGLGMASGAGARIGFAAMMRLAALAMTPSMLLFTAVSLAGVPNVPFGTLLGIGLTLGYLLFMIRAVKEDFPPPAYLNPYGTGQMPMPPAAMHQRNQVPPGYPSRG